MAANEETPAKKTTRTRTRKKAATTEPDASAAVTTDAPEKPARKRGAKKAAPPATALTFQAPQLATAPATRKKAAAKKTTAAEKPEPAPRPKAQPKSPPGEASGTEDTAADTSADAGADAGAATGGPRRRRRGRRGRGKGGAGQPGDVSVESADAADAAEGADDHAAARDDEGETSPTGSRRRRRRRRTGTGDGDDAAQSPDDPPNTVVRVRQPRGDTDGVRGVTGSTRLEARKQRRREGREAGRRPTILTEAEFLARRESVERVMVVRQTKDRTQVAVLEDGILVEHFVTRKESSSYVGNVYLGRVQNVLPSMEAAFVDIGRGRNAVLYAGEVNWDASGLEGQPRRIELALKSGQPVLVQVTKDPIGHKGARLTSQVSLPGRYVAYVPEGRVAGISRKLPENERIRLKSVLKAVTPEGAGVVVRTAAEGASEEELGRDIRRLQAQWEDIEKKTGTAEPPTLLYAEPDLVIRVIRDVFNEDFKELVISGEDEWDTVEQYVGHLAPDLSPRVRKWTETQDIFSAYRIDEQLTKALDRKVWLPSGGYLIIDRTEAMVVIDVNTGKFIGKGGNLEETVTKNNLEAAEEVVRQLRLRDLGGIIVIDFVDMVLESNRELVLRRLVECLGRDRTRHQVAEITSLGLVQMTRKRVGQGLLEAFSEQCPECGGRGVKIHLNGAPAKQSGGERPEPKKKSGRQAKKAGQSDKAEEAAEPAEATEGAEPEEATA
jgi:ribonuclease E